jgi:mRNA-degrading endonuclease RelE of RelBE toxin-antitoxin system
MRVRIAETFSRSLVRLEGPERAAVKRAVFDLLLGPKTPGLHLHRLVHAEDHRLWSIRVNRDLRVIVYRGVDELVLCHADHHDRAYAWAAHRTTVSGVAGDPEACAELAVDAAGTPPAVREPALGDRQCRAGPEIGSVPSPPEEPPLASPRRLRAWRRAAGPLPSPSRGAVTGAAPAPLLHLLQFFSEAEAFSTAAVERQPPGSSRAAGSMTVETARSTRGGHWPPLRAVALVALAAAVPCAQAALAGQRGPQVAAAVALGAALLQAALAGLVLAGVARHTARKAEEASQVVQEAAARPARELTEALEQLRRGHRPTMPQLQPASELRRAWEAIEALERFLTLEAGDIRSLADARAET